MKKELHVLAGPTAVGKTSLSIKYAKTLNAEIISADSIQVYKHMDIGSAKITAEEMQGIPHHLIDCLEPTENFDVARFVSMAKEAMNTIYDKGKIPLVVGGTGFYLHALIYDNDFSDGASDPEYRSSLEEEAKDPANDLYERLKSTDPEAAEAIPPGNVKRVIRALEYFHVTGQKISVHNREEREKESPYDLRFYVLNMPREQLYQRINLRVDKMVEEGLFEETEALIRMGVEPGMTSMQGLGYRQAYLYLTGKYSKEEAIDAIKKETRHFAKRQLTWFRKEREAVFVDKSEYESEDEIIDKMLR
ncbi:MAG: tRNA (adenosine(37)-N6)-dimethylallyltransferase MiaA [Lachnospiraceae bacterium]|nr:tRNA (adenosine(37)-N6)-dimethylallyltransferase MiaA [Lachnospiraceae bacterium]